MLKNIVRKLRGSETRDGKSEPKNHVESFVAFVNIINSVGYVLGTETVKDWKWSNRTMFTFIILLISLWSWFYSFSLIYNTFICVTLVAGSGLIAASTMKLGLYVMNNPKLHSLISSAILILKQNATGDRATILSNTVDKIYYHAKVLAFGTFIGLSVYSLYPVQDFLLNRNFTLVAPLFFPGVDENTLVGYLIITAFTMLATTIAVMGSLCFSFQFVALTDIYNVLVLLVEDDFRTFDKMWENPNKTKVERREAAFRNIILELTDAVNFVEYMNKLYGDILTVQIGSCYVGIVCSLFGYLQGSFPGGIGGVAYYSTELMMCCKIGTMLQTANADMVNVIYGSKWYSYGVKQQKGIIILLSIFQRVKPIIIAGFIPLNVETGKEIISNIYSLLMVMLNTML